VGGGKPAVACEAIEDNNCGKKSSFSTAPPRVASGFLEGLNEQMMKIVATKINFSVELIH
jgi:hypothetical protein